jgi:CheY-like chemotaxis protein
MKQQLDALVAQAPYLQEFLLWASRKSQTIPTETKLATTRSFYLALAQTPHTAAHFALASTLDQGMFLDAALENLLLEFATDHSQDFAYANACSAALSNILVMVLDAGFYKSLQQLRDQLPSPSQNRERQQHWWQQNYAAWVEQVRGAIAHYRNIQHSWQFTPEQQEVLQRYYDANQLLIDCLNSNCEVTAATRQDNQEPRCKQTGYESRFAPESQDSDCNLKVSPQSGGESDPYSIENEPDMTVVGQAGNGQEAIAQYRQLQPDVTLMDLRMPQMSGVDATAAICAEFARILMLTTYDGDEDIYRGLCTGAKGYLPHGVTEELKGSLE